MTIIPEAKLAREAELCYATLALATDYDVWHETHEPVSVEAVVQNLLKNVATAKDVLRAAIPAIGPGRTCECPSSLRKPVTTHPKGFPRRRGRGLGPLLDKSFRGGRGRAAPAQGSRLGCPPVVGLAG